MPHTAEVARAIWSGQTYSLSAPGYRCNYIRAVRYRSMPFQRLRAIVTVVIPDSDWAKMLAIGWMAELETLNNTSAVFSNVGRCSGEHWFRPMSAGSSLSSQLNIPTFFLSLWGEKTAPVSAPRRSAGSFWRMTKQTNAMDRDTTTFGMKGTSRAFIFRVRRCYHLRSIRERICKS